MRIVLLGDPRTKKNSQQMIMMGGKPRLLQSKAYRQYRDDCLRQITGDMRLKIDYPVNIQCVYYMGTRRRVDLVNLIEATLDILVDAWVLADDNSRIVVSHDGSTVDYDKGNPRVEIEIRE